MNLEQLSQTLWPGVTNVIVQAVFNEAIRQGYRIVPPGQVPMPINRPDAQMMKLLAEKYLAEHPEPQGVQAQGEAVVGEAVPERGGIG